MIMFGIKINIEFVIYNKIYNVTTLKNI